AAGGRLLHGVAMRGQPEEFAQPSEQFDEPFKVCQDRVLLDEAVELRLVSALPLEVMPVTPDLGRPAQRTRRLASELLQQRSASEGLELANEVLSLPSPPFQPAGPRDW